MTIRDVNPLPQDHPDRFEDELRGVQVPLLGFLVRLTGNVADARDLLQLASVTAWEKRDDYEPGTSLFAWMRQIASHHYRNELRKASRRPTVPLLDRDLEAMVETRHLEREREEARKRRLLQHCLEKLPDSQREAVDRFYLDGLSLEQLGVELDRKPNAVAQLLHRARQNLIRCVSDAAHRHLDEDPFHEV